MKDYYDILGVSHNTSKEDIKRAYYILAAQFHPDKNNGNEKRFKEINEAYRILSLESSRLQYDKEYDANQTERKNETETKEERTEQVNGEIKFPKKLFFIAPAVAVLVFAVFIGIIKDDKPSNSPPHISGSEVTKQPDFSDSISKDISPPQNNKFYKWFNGSFNVYDEHNNLAGTLIKAYTENCGSDCNVDVLFLKIGSNDKFNATPISILGGQSLGLDFVGKDKNIYRSTFIWGPSEGHFGCHYFKVEKVIYVDSNFELKDEFVTNKKYAFDSGDAKGLCDLFPGLEKIFTERSNIGTQKNN